MKTSKLCVFGIALLLSTAAQADTKQYELERKQAKKLYHALKTHDAEFIKKVLQEYPESQELQLARMVDMRDQEAVAAHPSMARYYGLAFFTVVTFIALEAALKLYAAKQAAAMIEKEMPKMEAAASKVVGRIVVGAMLGGRPAGAQPAARRQGGDNVGVD